ncbi:TetR/AcrR family transcriptional regulator [Euzebya pacifica]|uniref:TetR/AcrR family transcriptional regulator n=1 Tax=Euzebya pacifica TaxID=1608957 RepID=UPI0030F5E62C
MGEDERRDQIVAATRTAMNQFGVRRLTVSDVALEAGVSRQTIYEYFPGRDALVEVALEAGGWDVIAEGEARAAGASDPVDRLAAVLAAAIDYFAASPLWSTEAKRAELVPHVLSGDGAFASAAAAALEVRLADWWPAADPAAVTRAADTTVRLLISHGLAPEDTAGDTVAQEIAGLVGAFLTSTVQTG